MEIEPLLYKKLSPDDYDELERLINGNDEDDIKKAFQKINRFIYLIGITYIDTKPFIKNYGRVEDVHKAHNV